MAPFPVLYILMILLDKCQMKSFKDNNILIKNVFFQNVFFLEKALTGWYLKKYVVEKKIKKMFLFGKKNFL